MRDPYPFPTAWLRGGAERDAVVHSEAGCSRALSDALFPWRSSLSEARETRDRIVESLSLLSPGIPVLRLDEADPAEIRAAAEGGWIEGGAADAQASALAFADEGATAFVINDRDHLRIVCRSAGSSAADAYARLRSWDEALEATLPFAAELRRGYLGAGIAGDDPALSLRSVAFIPGILASGVFERVSKGLLASDIEPRIRADEADAPPSPFLELLARCPFASTEEDFVAAFTASVHNLAEGERLTRSRLVSSRRLALEDAAGRAAALLPAVRLLSEGEAADLLAELRAGLAYGLLEPSGGREEDPFAAVDSLAIRVRGGNTRLVARVRNLPSDRDSLDALRAALVRADAPRYHIA